MTEPSATRRPRSHAPSGACRRPTARSVRSDAAGADRMESGCARRPEIGDQRLVARRLRSRPNLALDQLGERPGRRDAARQFQRRQTGLDVVGMRKMVRDEFWIRRRIGIDDMARPPRARPDLERGDRHAVEIIERDLFCAAVAAARHLLDLNLEVGVRPPPLAAKACAVIVPVESGPSCLKVHRMPCFTWPTGLFNVEFQLTPGRARYAIGL